MSTTNHIEIGKTYRVNHRRKGEFFLRVDYISKDGNWIGGTIVGGRVRYMAAANADTGHVGDTATISKVLATFEEVADDAQPA